LDFTGIQVNHGMMDEGLIIDKTEVDGRRVYGHKARSGICPAWTLR
jgi:hypothetical protein